MKLVTNGFFGESLIKFAKLSHKKCTFSGILMRCILIQWLNFMKQTNNCESKTHQINISKLAEYWKMLPPSILPHSPSPPPPPPPPPPTTTAAAAAASAAAAAATSTSTIVVIIDARVVTTINTSYCCYNSGCECWTISSLAGPDDQMRRSDLHSLQV